MVIVKNMKLLILYRPNSEEASRIESFVSEFKKDYPQTKVELNNMDSRDGIATASIYDIFHFPSVLALNNDGTIIDSWQGIESLPRLQDLSAYVNQ